MSAGLTYRLGRIFGHDGRAMILPVDHGLMLGRIPGLEQPKALVEAAAGAGCDGLLMSAGLARATAGMFAHRHAPARLLTLDTLLGANEQDAGAAALVASVEQAARLGADAVKLLMAWDVPGGHQAAAAKRIAAVAGEAARWEIPLMVEPVALRTPRSPQTIELELDAARIAMELGADIIKMAYPGSPEVMKSLSEELGLPVVILGGPKVAGAAGLVRLVGEAMAAGASGIVIGRQVWQRSPAERSAVMRALVEVVHGRLDADEAVKGLQPVA
jgi:class I fructose-bisphosphate aldolase